MTGNHSNLTHAILVLRRAVEAELKGNSYYLVAQHVMELGELVPNGKNGVARHVDAFSFATALDHVRKHAERDLTGNVYYMFAHKLDVLSFVTNGIYRSADPSLIPPEILISPASDVEPVSAATGALGNGLANADNPAVRSFDDLAKASTARVESAMSRAFLAYTPASGHEIMETGDDGELRRRRSGDGEIDASEPLQSMAASRFHSETVAGAIKAIMPAHLGSPPVKIHCGFDADQPREQTQKTPHQEGSSDSTSAHDTPPFTASKAVKTANTAAALEPSQRTLIARVLQAVTGRSFA